MNKLSKVQIIGITAFVASVFFVATALAFTLPGQATSHQLSVIVTPRELRAFGGGGGGGTADTLQNARLKAKLRACQAREKGIKNRSTHLADLVKNMEDKFGDIAKRVEDYYTNTVVPSGKTVTNYDTLVSDISTKKTAVDTALTKAQTDFSGFSCTSGKPKAAMAQFRDDMRATKQALKDYRTSIKNLIVAVHGVTGTENKNTENEQHPNAPTSRGGGPGE